MTKMPCALCLQVTELRKSHIIPQFLYSYIYDPDHKYYVLSTADDEPTKLHRTGLYEQLLCAECEARLSRYEDYAAKVLKGGIEISKQEFPDRIVCGQIDYTLFKLFQMSLLWRAAACSHPSMERINLGPHAETLRRMILDSNPGKPHHYGCILFFSPGMIEIMKKAIHPFEPVPKKIQGFQTYRAVFGGMLWAFIVSSHSEKYPYQQAFLSENGQLPIFNAGQFGKSYIESVVAEFRKRGKLQELEGKKTPDRTQDGGGT